ncbi:hypothetical protein [Pseudomonas aeruginosa]|uniref:hypothetical protein n=1 Tax=Pseudomonas aeruginosa TaxID=287 RepID=UPI000B506012|nr:hypothetical protein [Pseudomonas aeruginosa]ASD11631.1 hypothetical protein CD800_22075 [Pseudomonas aeruginosa]
MSRAAISALYRCGEGRIEYTRGVLDALGYQYLAFEIGVAAREVKNSEPAPFTDDDIEAALAAPPASDAYHAAVARLHRAFEQVDAIKVSLQNADGNGGVPAASTAQ